MILLSKTVKDFSSGFFLVFLNRLYAVRVLDAEVGWFCNHPHLHEPEKQSNLSVVVSRQYYVCRKHEVPHLACQTSATAGNSTSTGCVQRCKANVKKKSNQDCSISTHVFTPLLATNSWTLKIIPSPMNYFRWQGGGCRVQFACTFTLSVLPIPRLLQFPEVSESP